MDREKSSSLVVCATEDCKLTAFGWVAFTRGAEVVRKSGYAFGADGMDNTLKVEGKGVFGDAHSLMLFAMVTADENAG